MKPLLVLRPEPGNGATAARARAMGLEVRQLPLFGIAAVPWTAPDPRQFDALLLTSANAIRCGGDALDKLRALEVIAVGPATLAAAQGAGFRVRRSGAQGVDDLLQALPAGQRLLHLAGVDNHPPDTRQRVETIAVYRADPLDVAVPQGPLVALVHSARAGARLAQLAPDRAAIAIAAISAQAAAACGGGWRSVDFVPQPRDGAMLALAARLCQE